MANDDSPNDEASGKLDMIIRLLAYLVAADHDNLEDRAVALSGLGLAPKEIARVCNTTPNTVSVRLAEAKKKTGRKKAVVSRKGRR